MGLLIGTKKLSNPKPNVMLDNVSYSAYQSGNNVIYTITVQMRTDNIGGWYDWGWYYNMWVNGIQIVSNGTVKGRTGRTLIRKNIYQSSATAILPLGSALLVTIQLWSATSATATSHYDDFGTFSNDGGAAPPLVVPPQLSSLNVFNVGDKYLQASFDIINNGGQSPDYYIDVATNNFSNVIGVRTSPGQFDNLDAGRTYYVRGNAGNGAGRTYTNVVGVTTVYYVPNEPISLSCNKTILNNVGSLTWVNPSSTGSNMIVGYRIRIYKNNGLFLTIDTGNTALLYNYTFLERDWRHGDIFKFDICAYSVRWDGAKMYGNIQTSSNYFVETDKYVYLLVNSNNPNDFVKVDLELLVNSNLPQNFVEVKKNNVALNINSQWVDF